MLTIECKLEKQDFMILKKVTRCQVQLIFDLKLTNPRQWCCVTPHRTYDKSLRVTTTLMRGCWSGTEFGHYLVSSSMSL